MISDNQQATLGWLSGIFDTDGSFSIRLGHKRTFTPFASVTNTNKFIIEGVASELDLLGVGRHVSWKSNGPGAKPLGIVCVTGMMRLMRLFSVLEPIIKDEQLGLLKEYVARRLSMPKNTRYSDEDEKYRMSLKSDNPVEPQRLHAMLSQKSDSFLAGWLAGVIDGDGSLMIQSGKIPSNQQWRVYPDIVIINSDPNMMEATKWVMRKFGSNCSIIKKHNGPKATKPIYHAQTGSHKRAEPILDIISGHLRGKAEQAQLLKELIDYRKTVPYRSPHGNTEGELQRKVKMLNKRGDEDIV